LIPNAGFDSSISNWSDTTNLTISHTSLDASGCASSGSILVTYTGPVGTTVTALSTCFVISPGTAYNLGAWIYLPSGHGTTAASVGFNWYTDTACRNMAPSPSAIWLNHSKTNDVWQYVHEDAVVPPSGARSAFVNLSVSNDKAGPEPAAAYFDDLYLTPTPGRF
jgi:hypothetical protein